MGLPALRDDPPTTAGSMPGAPAPTDTPPAPGDAIDLATIVESVFDPSTDCVIYESAMPPGTNGTSAAALHVPHGAGLAAAAACGVALQRTARSRFVVAVVSGAGGEAVPELLALREHCVVLMCGGAAAAALESALTGGGWRIADLRGQSTARGIAKALVAARYDERSKLVLIDWPAPESSVEPAPLVRFPRLPRNDPDIGVQLAADLRRRIAADPRIVPVILVDEPPWSTLADTDADVGRRVYDLERGLVTAAAFAYAGCHPVVVVRRSELEGRAEAVSGLLSGRPFRGTLIVVGPEGGASSRVQWPAEFEQRVLAADAGAVEAMRVLGECLSGRGGTVLSVMAGRVVPAEPNASRTAATAGGVSAGVSQQGIPFAVSAQSAQLDQQEIEHKRLRLEALQWVQDYDRVGRRNLYLWRWCLHGIELTTFPDVGETWRTHLHDTKLLSVILCVLFDDVADRHGRAELLETLIQSASARGGVAAASMSGTERDYVEVTQRLWSEYEARVREYPQYPVFERLWRFDLLQFLNTMRYAHLVNSQPGLLNLTEHDIYTPHNMLMVSFSTLDLMCVAHFHSAELGRLREAMWHAQAMGRIGNVLSTWRRELSEADRSNGMFAGDTTLSTSTRERLLLDKWRWHRSRCHAAAEQVSSLDLIPVLRGHDRFFDMHLASAGRI